jgi:hypothetical protein
MLDSAEQLGLAGLAACSVVLQGGGVDVGNFGNFDNLDIGVYAQGSNSQGFGVGFGGGLEFGLSTSRQAFEGVSLQAELLVPRGGLAVDTPLNDRFGREGGLTFSLGFSGLFIGGGLKYTYAAFFDWIGREDHDDCPE